MDILKELDTLKRENERLRKNNVYLYSLLHSIHGMVAAMPPEAAQEYNYSMKVYEKFRADMEGIDFRLAKECARAVSSSSSIQSELNEEELHKQILQAMAVGEYDSILEILRDAKDPDDPELNGKLEELLRQMKEKTPGAGKEAAEEKREEQTQRQEMTLADTYKGQFKRPDNNRIRILSK